MPVPWAPRRPGLGSGRPTAPAPPPRRAGSRAAPPPRALRDIPRNLTDDQIKRIAAKGGVVMISVSSYFIDPKVVEADRAERQKLAPDYLKIKQDLAGDPKKRDEAIGKLFDTLTRHRSVWTPV